MKLPLRCQLFLLLLLIMQIIKPLFTLSKVFIYATTNRFWLQLQQNRSLLKIILYEFLLQTTIWRNHIVVRASHCFGALAVNHYL